MAWRTIILALASLTLSSTSAQAQPSGDAAKGKILFLQCAACHATAAGAPAKIGPNLSGIMGAAAGTRPGFAYSDAMKKAGPWSDARMNAFLEKPSATVPGTKMIFGGIADPAKRAAIIAYLRSLP